MKEKGILITGHAGSGKTTKLLEYLKNFIESRKISDHKVISVMSFMHGARARLEKRISTLKNNLNISRDDFDIRIQTIDSLALQILNKQRALIGQNKPFIPYNSEIIQNPVRGNIPVSEICEKTNKLFKFNSTKILVKNTYPLFIIDEFQDCSGSKLKFVNNINKLSPIIVAGDEFQVLNDQNTCPPIDWAKETLENHNKLGNKSKRSKNNKILQTAQAIRENTHISKSDIIPIKKEQANGLLAFRIVEEEVFNGSEGNTALLTYSFDKNFKKFLNLLNQERSSDENMVQVPFLKLRSQVQKVDALFSRIQSLFDQEIIVQYSLGSEIQDDIIQNSVENCIFRARHEGKKTFHQTELKEEVARLIHLQRSYKPIIQERVALTIHSAKNQEWDNIYVYWAPFQFKDSTSRLKKRKLLYNAITRARENCTVLLFDPGNEYKAESEFINCFIRS